MLFFDNFPEAQMQFNVRFLDWIKTVQIDAYKTVDTNNSRDNILG